MVDMNEECRKIAEDTIEILKGLEGDEAAQREYFDDILDIDYIVNGFNRSYRGVIIAVTLHLRPAGKGVLGHGETRGGTAEGRRRHDRRLVQRPLGLRFLRKGKR